MVRTSFAGLLSALAALWVSTVPTPAADFREGTRFPEILLPRASDGEPASVNQYLGQKVLMHIFASW